MKILLTNDDGYSAKGLQLIKEKLQKYGDVFVVAPTHSMSAKSASLTIGKPLSPIKVKENEYMLDGTPVDCVAFALSVLFHDIDLVVAGVNEGWNVSYDTIYSGTVGACLEAMTYRRKAIAFSSEDGLEMVDKHFDDVMKYILNNDLLSEEYFLNVNFPLKGEYKGIALDHLYYRKDKNYFEKHDEGYYAYRNIQMDFIDDVNSDCYHVYHGIISITPLNKSYYSKLNQNKLTNIFNDENCLNPNMKRIIIKNESILFPEEFEIVDENIYENIIKIYKLKNGNKINYYFSKSMLFFKYENIQNNDNSNQFNNSIIICSLRKDENKNIIFSPLFKYIYFEEEQMNKEFHNLFNYNINTYNFENRAYIYKSGNIIGYSYSLEIKNNDYKIKMYLNILIDIYKESSNLQNIIIKNTNEECKYYLINKKLLDNLKNIFYYKDLCDIINKYKKQILEENKVDILINNLSDIIKNKLNNLNEEKIKKKLTDKDKYKLELKKYQIDTKKYLDYYSNCQIIDEKLLKYFQIIGKVPFENKEVECILKDKFCIIKSYKDQVINLGILDENNIFLVKKLITSIPGKINKIFSEIKNKGIADFIKNNKNNLNSKIYSINEAVNNNYMIIDKKNY